MNDRAPDGREPENDVEDRSDDAPVTVRLASAGRGPGVIVGLVAVFLAIALIKPWTFGGVSTRPTPRPTAPAAPAPSADPLAALRLHCQEPDGWRVYSSEHWAALTVHSWRTLDPAPAADGPLDPRIPIVAVVAEIDGLGYCSPWTTAQRPPADAQVDGWVITDGGNRGGHGVVLTLAEPIPLQPIDSSWPTVAGNLYAPPDNRFDPMIVAPVDWPGGRYVFAVRAPGYQRWWGVDVEPPPIQAPSPNIAPGKSSAPSSKPANP
jgi:hypothetical protein